MALDDGADPAEISFAGPGKRDPELRQAVAAGVLVRKNYPVTIVPMGGNAAAGGAHETASVVGPLCTPLDLLADRMDLPLAHVGDVVIVFQSGAYGASASPQAFLGQPACLEVLA